MENELTKGLFTLLFTGIASSFIKSYFDFKVKTSESIYQNRTKAYIDFVKVTRLLPKYCFPERTVSWKQLSVLPNSFTEWYFSGNGIFVSDTFRNEYFKFQEFIIKIIEINTKKQDENLTHDEYKEIRSKLSKLRTLAVKELKTREPLSFWKIFQKNTKA